MSEKKIDEDWKSRARQEPEAGPLGAPDFLSFVSGLASQTLVHLGAIPHPMTGKAEADPEQARYVIDVLEMLEQKTRGNLTPEEAGFLQQVLSDLRLAFVKVTTGGK